MSTTTPANEMDSLHEEIIKNRVALASFPEEDPGHADACETLADSLWRSYEQNGDYGHLDEVMSLGRKVVAARAEGHPRRVMACRRLAKYLWPRYKQTGNTSLLDESINLEREMVRSHPAPHPDRVTFCANLAVSLSWQYKQTGNPNLLHEVIILERQVLAAHPDRHPSRAASCGRLAESLRSRYEQTGDTALLDEVIDLGREALGLRPKGHPQRAISCGTLSASLKLYYNRIGDLDLLDEAIALEREALSLRPEGHPHHASSCGNLATYLKLSYEQTGDDTAVDEAIALERKALMLSPHGPHSERFMLCENLALSLSLRYQKTGDASLLDEAIALEQEALALCGTGHPNRALSYSNLSAYLMLRYKRDGDVALLGEAVTLEHAALALRPDGHPLRASSCGNLALYLSLQYQQTGELALLDKAITLDREVLTLCPERSPGRATACGNLASCLRLLYQQAGSEALLNEAIALEREALALRPNNHLDRARSCGNIALYLTLRYQQTGHVSLLEEAITWEREAISLRGVGHPDRAMSCGNLAQYARLYYERTGNNESLDEAIRLEREAFALRPHRHPNRAMSCGNLALSLGLSYKNTGHVTLLDEAIELEREALVLRPSGHPERALTCSNLAIYLQESYTETRNGALLEEALELLKESISSSPPSATWCPQINLSRLHLRREIPFFSVSAALDCMQKISDILVDNIHGFTRNMSGALELLWSCRDAWADDVPSSLACVYSRLIDRLPSLAGHALDAPSQLSALGFVGSVGSDACISALLGQRPAQAVELLDRARGVMWAQALRLRDPQLEDIPEDLAHELERLLCAVNVRAEGDTGGPQLDFTQENRHLTSLDIRHQQNSRIQAIFREVRAVPGLERFMLGSTFEQLRETARAHPVVVLVAARGYAYALIMISSAQAEPHALPLSITSARLSSLRDNARRAGLRDAQITPEDDWEEDARIGMYKSSTGSKTNTDPLTVLLDIWVQVVKPVIDHLQLQVSSNDCPVETEAHSSLQPSTGRERPRLHWCPTSDFAFLPLHAAGVYDGPYHRRTTCSDYVVSSYTPTISALLRAQSKVPHVAPSRVDVLAIAEDCRTSKTMPRLWSVDQELTHIESVVKASALDCTVEIIAKGATVDRVTSCLPSAHFVHLACHGTQHPTAALESGFHLSDETLTVSKLMSLDLKQAWFAYLSACETAKGDAKQPDQGVHLAAAMLFAGFKSVVATMWYAELEPHILTPELTMHIGR
jgi:tetratricopeptide (TPR) repeat protein